MVTSLEDLMQTLRLRLGDYLKEVAEIDDPVPAKKFCCLSPDHDDSSPSMNIHANGVYVKCFSCERSADIFTVCHWLEDKPLEGPDFVKDNVFYLADKFGIKYNIIQKDSARSAMKYAYLRAFKVVCDYINHTAKHNPTEEYTHQLTKVRKWPKKETTKQGIGCIANFNELMDVLKTNGFTKEFITLIGLNRPDLFNKDNFIFSIFDEFGRPVAFYSRDVNYEDKIEKFDKKDKLEVSIQRRPSKYNSTANFAGIYEKQLTPYGLHECKNFHKVIFVEGHACRHSLRVNGIHNSLALGGLALNEITLNKLASLGVTQIVLLLDNDSKGKDKIKSVIRQYYGKSSMDFSVLDMASVAPDVKDPDEYFRKYTAEQFNTIKETDAITWLAMTELATTNDPYTMLQEITPLIALERSPLSRLKIINTLSEITGIDKETIEKEVDQKISTSKDRKGEFAARIFEEAKEMLLMNPGAIDGALAMVESKLGALTAANTNDDLFSSNETLKSIVKMQELEESDREDPVVLTGFHDWDQHMALPTEEAYTLVIGPPNTGKTALFNTLAVSMLDNNPELIVLMFTNDDSRSIYINRIVAGQSKIKINWVKRPKFFLNEELGLKRGEAYRKLSNFVTEERLVIKDVEHGNSVEYVGKLIKYYRDRYPQKNIVAFCDNFHRLDYESNNQAVGKDKFKAMSAMMKSYTTKYSCNVICSVEMTKEGMYEKPTNAKSISEAASLQFDANVILYLWNDVNVNRDDAKLKFNGNVLDYYAGPDGVHGYISKILEKPIIECIVLKSKISDFKGSLFFKFHPELSLYDECSIVDAEAIMAENKKDDDDKPKRRIMGGGNQQ